MVIGGHIIVIILSIRCRVSSVIYKNNGGSFFIMYVGFIFYGTYLGYGIGSAPIIGYHYGSGNKDELKSLFKKSLKLLGVGDSILTFILPAILGLNGIWLAIVVAEMLSFIVSSALLIHNRNKYEYI